MTSQAQDPVFSRITDRLLASDPITFCEKYLTLEGKSFRINKNGYRPYTEIYRYIGVKALEKSSKPVVILKSRQTGATTMASAMEMYFLCSGLFGNGINPPIRIIHSFPQLDLAFAYAKVKLNSMISSSILVDEDTKKIKGQKTKSYIQSLLDTSSPANDSLQFKQFIGGNHLWIESTGIDGQRLRGKTCDVIFFDEVQDTPRAAIANAIKTLNKAQYGAQASGVQVYFGTPKQRGSAFWEMWNKSSQQYFYLGCEKCRKHFPLYTPGSNDWEDIWLYGYIVRCVHCGYEQNKFEAAERGKWVASKDSSDCQYIGFHINQLYMPDITKERVMSEKPGVSAINTEKSYQNEVLGEFFHGEATIITPEQIRDICGDPERKFMANSASLDVPIFLGIDIGDKADLEQLLDDDKIKGRGQSYSTAVVLAMTGPTRLEIIFATKFKRNDLASKKGIIDQIMRQYRCTLAICDIGHATDLNEILQTEYGMKFLSSRSSPQVHNRIKFYDDTIPKEIRFEKDYWISALYDQMKKGSVRFPLGSYEQIAWLIQHCTSMEIKPSVSRTGDITPRYVKGSTPNDGMMALLNAYLAYRYHISGGFAGPTGFSGEAPREPPRVLAGYVPKLL